MITFNPGDNVHVTRDDDGLKIRFDGDTFAVNPTSTGFAVNNDWNNRHFTIAFGENSLLYHVTREDEDDSTSGKKAVSPGEAVAEFYGYIRSLAPPVPKDEIPFEFAGRAQFEEMKVYLKDEGVVRDTDTGIEVMSDARDELETSMQSNPGELGALFQRVLDPVPIENIVEMDGEEHIYFYPTPSEIIVLFPFPDDYVGVTTVQQVFNFAEVAGGSQIIDHMLRAMSD